MTTESSDAQARAAVAILGTGRMGGAMAHRLASAGFDLTLWNRTPSKAEELHVGRVVASPAEAVRHADVVISILTNDVAVREVYLGAGGVFEAASGQVFVEASTAGPDVAVEVGREAEGRGVHLLTAPVIGSVPAVESGTLLILAGGDPADAERARPVLEQLGEVRHVGDRVSAQRLKLIVNSMLAITSAAAAELIAAATAEGLDREQAFALLKRLAPALGVRERGFLQDQHTPSMFTVRDMVKDLDLSLAEFSRSGVSAPLTQRARELFASAARDSADLDITAVGRRTQ